MARNGLGRTPGYSILPPRQQLNEVHGPLERNYLLSASVSIALLPPRPHCFGTHWALFPFSFLSTKNQTQPRTMVAAFVSAVASLAPYHLLAYGTLLGTELYQVNEKNVQERNS